MVQLWRLCRILWVTWTYTLATSVAARRVPRSERAAFRARRQQAGARLLCDILRLNVSVEGGLPVQGGMLMICNHFGVLDPLVLASRFPVAFVGKAELRGWPLVGWVCAQMGIIFVQRERRTQTVEFVEKVRKRLHQGVSVLVFPEGTTSAGHVLPFKTGAFAAVANVQDEKVLPLYLEVTEVDGRPATEALRERVVWAGGSKSFLKHFWELLSLQDIHMVVHVGQPVSTEGRDRKDLARLTHARVCALRPEAGGRG